MILNRVTGNRLDGFERSVIRPYRFMVPKGSAVGLDGEIVRGVLEHLCERLPDHAITLGHWDSAELSLTVRMTWKAKRRSNLPSAVDAAANFGITHDHLEQIIEGQLKAIEKGKGDQAPT